MTNKNKRSIKNKPSRSRKQKRIGTDIVVKYLSQQQKPVTTKAVAETLGRVNKAGREEVYAILVALSNQGKVKQISKNSWAMPQAVKSYRGKVVGHVDGHGYVLTESKEKISLRAQDMREVLHNDIVLVSVTGRDRRKRLFGQILEVVERGNDIVIGRYFSENNINFVVPDDQRIGQDIFILPEHVNGAESGQVVSTKITKHPNKNSQPMGEIIEILGDHLAPGMEIQIALRKHDLPHQWPGSVNKQIADLSEEVSEQDIKGRKDIRDLALVTIDGEDARDFDDAVYCEPLPNNKTRLLVAIADVSHYVKQGTPLDDEAWQRGNSVYFPQNVIPMLPEVLSNGLCSLKPQVNRLCFVCDMVIDATGKIEDYNFYQAVMYSHARLTYTQVAQLIGGGENQIPAQLKKPIENLYQLYKRLKNRRLQHGTIEFEVAETMILFDENRKIDKIVPRTRNDAHKLIEECMLAANICASLCLEKSDLVGMYRVHERPDDDKIAEARQFLRQFKLLLNGGEQPQAKHFSEVIAKVDDPQTAHIVQMALLRSMKQARYSEENTGHFALNFDSYTHFTSPIRRYPDLVVHRQLARIIANPKDSDDEQALIKIAQTAEQVSVTERRADDATRDVIQWLKCEFMSHKIGEKLWGIVSSVTEFGLFVELEEIYVDGLVHITSLGQDYYRYDADKRQLVGETSKRIYKMGQRLEVQVARVDMEQGRIDFALTDVLNEKHEKRHHKRSRKGATHRKGKRR